MVLALKHLKLLLVLIILPLGYPIESSFGQTVRGEPSGNITLRPMDIFEVGFTLKKDETIQYNFQADQFIFFDIHAHEGDQIIIYEATEAREFRGSFTAPKDGDYYFMVQNFGLSNANIQYDISLGQNVHLITYEEMQFDLMVTSNSNVEIVDFSQEEKRISIRVITPYLTPGFVSVTIPRVLLDGPFELQGSFTEYEYSQDDELSTFIINTRRGTHDIAIIGTTVVPEVTLPLLFLVFAIASLLFITKMRSNILNVTGTVH